MKQKTRLSPPQNVFGSKKRTRSFFNVWYWEGATSASTDVAKTADIALTIYDMGPVVDWDEKQINDVKNGVTAPKRRR